MNTDFKIIKFYEIEREDSKAFLTGTLHIRLAMGIDLKGIYLHKKKDFLFCGLPNRKGCDRSTGNTISYATFLFEDKKLNNEFIANLRDEAKKFIEQYLLENPNPLPQIPKANNKQLVIQQKKSKELLEKKENSEKAHVLSDSQENAAEAERTQPTGKAASDISQRNWITLPERKRAARKTRLLK